MPSLLVVSGARTGERIEVDRSLVIGRFGADVVIDDPELSRHHVEIRLDGDGLVVEDLGSTNGTFVDARPIDAPTHIGPGERMKLGSTVLEVEAVAETGATRLSRRADLEGTRLATAAPAVRSEPVAVVEPAVAVAAVEAPVTAFKPPRIKRGRGLASRSWIPVVLSFGTAILTAVALVIYFAQR
ncbi:MAG TPA: FHA domain-containing protein [Solirubrobacteraceae bacterium]|nr:FHA domain-containing protein [Solirubrobacteraceae bacterium]